MFTSLASLKALTLAMMFLGSATLLNSQETGELQEGDEVAVEEVTVITPVVEIDQSLSPEERLAELRKVNEQLLARQKATLQKLEKLQREAEQLRIFARRT